MPTINYVFDGDDFEYEVEPHEVEQCVIDWLCDNWTHEECAEFIVGLDGERVDLFEDFKDVIEDAFRDDAKEFYYECKNSDNGVDQGDFV